MFEGAFASLAELKARQGIGSGDTGDDAVLTELLLGASGAIESCAGRRLRRVHCVTEHFGGGRDLIRVAHAPLAHVHSVRESWDRDFDTAGAYDELVEGVDYVRDAAGEGERPGQGGWLRRLNGPWRGSARNPGMVQVVYTGGYKTADEAALEALGTVTISGTVNTSLAAAFSVAARYSSSVFDGYLAQFVNAGACKAGVEYSAPVSLVNRAALAFLPGAVLLPTWTVTEATLVLKVYRSDGSAVLSVDTFILPYEPRRYLGDLGTLYDLIGGLAAGGVYLDNTTTAVAGSPDTVTISIHGDPDHACGANMALLNQVLQDGFLAFALRSDNEALATPRAMGVCTPLHATAANRPTLTLAYRPAVVDDWATPHDLRHACLQQAVADWHARRNPAMKSETMRGVSVASGISYLRDPATLLPSVRDVALRYARVV